MLRQVVPLVLVAIIGATPMMREFCRIACDGAPSGAASHAHHGGAAMPDHQMAGHDMGDAEPPAHSTHHEHAADEPAAIQDQPRADCGSPALGPRRDCCDEAALQVRASTARQLVDPPAVLPRVIGSTVRGQTVSTRAFEESARPPVPLALRTPLRV